MSFTHGTYELLVTEAGAQRTMLDSFIGLAKDLSQVI